MRVCIKTLRKLNYLEFVMICVNQVSAVALVIRHHTCYGSLSDILCLLSICGLVVPHSRFTFKRIAVMNWPV